MTPTQLSDELRHGTGNDLRRRRAVVGLALGSAAVMGLISLYQTGLVRTLPEPPVPGPARRGGGAPRGRGGVRGVFPAYPAGSGPPFAGPPGAGARPGKGNRLGG